MKKLLLTFIALCSFSVFAETLYFNGTIGNSCTLANATNGRLVQVGPTKLEANNQGSPASISVINNAAGTYKLTITQPSGWNAAPQTVSNTGFQILPRLTGPNATSGFTPSGGKTESVLNIAGTDVVTVGMFFEEFALPALPVGDYSVVVTVLCEPK